MTTATATERNLGRSLTKEEVDSTLEQPNGTHLLLEYCREGLVSPEVASDAIEQYQIRNRRRVKRFVRATFEAILGY